MLLLSGLEINIQTGSEVWAVPVRVPRWGMVVHRFWSLMELKTGWWHVFMRKPAGDGDQRHHFERVTEQPRPLSS